MDKVPANKKTAKVEEVKVSENLSEVKKTEAEKLWDEIKDKSIEMFALPSQTVQQYCRPVAVDPNKLFLLITATSVLPALELTLGNKYLVERMERFVVVSHAPTLLVK